MMDIFDDMELIQDDLDDVLNVRDVVEIPRMKIYLPRIDPFHQYSDEEFKKIYRFQKATLMTLVNSVRHLLSYENNRGLAISPEIQVLSTIRYLAKGNYQSEAANLHGFCQSTMSRITARVTRVIAAQIDQYIKFPSNEELNNVKQKFYNIAEMVNIVGAVDGTHIKIKNPGDYPMLYINRKGFFSLNVQVVCDAECRILDIVARWRGSAHDSRIWNNCQLKERFETGDIPGHLIGDNGYPSSNYMLVPYLNADTPGRRRYNSAHIKTRNVVERLFGQWKNKFRCFFNGMHMALDTAKAAIIALAVLHNIAVDERAENEEIIEEHQENNENINNINENNMYRDNYVRQYFD